MPRHPMVSDNRTGLAIVNFSIMKHAYYKIRLPFCYLLVGIVAFNYASIIALVFGTNKEIFTSEVKAINKQWQTNPIVSIYISPRYLGERCAQGYEAVELNSTTANSISGGSCSCEQSLVGSCSVGSSAVSEACLAMNISAKMKSKSWQGSTVCIKRGGEAVLTRYLDWLSMPYNRKRPLPDLLGTILQNTKGAGRVPISRTTQLVFLSKKIVRSQTYLFFPPTIFLLKTTAGKLQAPFTTTIKHCMYVVNSTMNCQFSI